MTDHRPIRQERGEPRAEDDAQELRAGDIVEECSRESFPASDPPAFVWRRHTPAAAH